MTRQSLPRSSVTAMLIVAATVCGTASQQTGPSDRLAS
jgi:hypothetical protein